MRDRDPHLYYLAMQSVEGALSALVFSALSVYYVTVVRMDPLQLVLVGTVLELTCFISQVPTGALADALGRRRIIVAGYALMGAGFALEGAVPRFSAILVAQVIWGLGVTMLDGATQAWLAGEVGEAGLAAAFTRGAQLRQLGWVAGIPCLLLLGRSQVNLPVIVGGLAYIAFAGVCALMMPERGYSHAAGNRIREAAAIALEGLRLARRSPRLVRLMAVAGVFGLCSEGFDRLAVAHLLRDLGLGRGGPLTPLMWIAALDCVAMVVDLLALEVVRRLTRRRPGRGAELMASLGGARTLAMVGFGMATGLVPALIAFWISGACRTATQPLYDTWLAANTQRRSRATVISLAGQMDALGQIAGGPLIGLLGKLVSIRAALVVAGLSLVPAIPLLAGARTGSSTDPTEEVVE